MRETIRIVIATALTGLGAVGTADVLLFAENWRLTLFTGGMFAVGVVWLYADVVEPYSPRTARFVDGVLAFVENRIMVVVIFAPAIIMFVAAAWLALSDVLTWLKTAQSRGYTNSWLLYDLGFSNQQTGWLGLQKILKYVLGWPAWSGVLIGAVGTLIVSVSLSGGVLKKLEEIEVRRREQQLNDGAPPFRSH